MNTNLIFLLIALLAGAAAAVQSGVNSQLRSQLANPVVAALISFAVGTLLLLLYVMAFNRGNLPAISSFRELHWWKWTGGLLGAFYVTAVILAAPRLGAATTTGLIVAGQLITAIVLDHFGLVGFSVQQVSIWRLLGAVLLIAGVVLIMKK